MELAEAFAQIQGNPELGTKFQASPEETLKELGVDTTGITIRQIQDVPGSTPTIGGVAIEAANVCVSAGVGFCISIGG